MIRGSDGLDYEDLTARLLGEPARTARNFYFQSTVVAGRSPEYRAAYREAYDHYAARGHGPDPCHWAASAQANLTDPSLSAAQFAAHFAPRRQRGTSGVAIDSVS